MGIRSDSELVLRLLEGVRLERSAHESAGSDATSSQVGLTETEDTSQKTVVRYSAVLRAAEDLLSAIASSDTAVPLFNRELASSVVRGPTRKASERVIAVVANDLTPDQNEACRCALSTDVSYIWGPAGTGKTVTLGALAAHLFGEHKRVLIVAHTHQAVDGVLLALCNRIVRGPRSQLPEGSVVKLGSITREALRSGFGDAVSFDSLTAIARRKMEGRLQELSIELSEVERRIWRSSHVKTLRDHERSLTEERASLEASLKAQGSTLSRLFRPALAEGEAAHLAGLRADLALVEASLAEVKRSLEASGSADEPLGDLTELLERQKDLSGGIALLEGFVRDISSHVLSRARVVGATSAKAALRLSQLGQFDAVLIDEASMMPMVMSYLVAGMAKERVVVAGDFRQLPPISRNQSESARVLFAQSVFESSGISKTMVEGGELPHVSILTSHFRSHPEIMELLNERFYNRRLVSAYSESDRSGVAESHLELLKKRVTIVDTSALSPEGAYRQGSKWNPVQAVVVSNIVHALKASNAMPPQDIGVITPFRAQAEVVQSLLLESGLGSVACGTVHRFQGDERRIIVLDLVESAPHRVGPFLSGGSNDDVSARLVNVALSRAKEYLIIVANVAHLREKLGDDSLIRGLLLELAERGQVLRAEGFLGASGLGVLPAQLFCKDEFYPALVGDLLEARREVAISSISVSGLGAAVLSGVLEGAVASGVSAVAALAEGCEERDVGILRAAGVFVNTVAAGECRPASIIIDDEVVWLGQSSPLAADVGASPWSVRVVSPALASMTRGLYPAANNETICRAVR